MRDEQAKSQKSQAKEGLFVAAGFGDRKLWRRKLVRTAAASLSMAPRHSIVSRWSTTLWLTVSMLYPPPPLPPPLALAFPTIFCKVFSFFFSFSVFFGWLWFRNATNINDQTKLLPEIVTRIYFYPFLPLVFSLDNDHEISGKGGDLGFNSRFLGFLDLWIFWIWKVTQRVGQSVFPFAGSISSAPKVWNWCHTFLMDFCCTFFLLQILPKVKFCKWSACWEHQGVLSVADKLFFKPEECSMSVDGSMYPSSSCCRSYGEICERSARESRVSCWRQVL